MRVAGGHCVATAIQGTAPECNARRDFGVSCKKTCGGGNQKGRRRRLKPESLRTGWMASQSTLFPRERVRQLAAEQIWECASCRCKVQLLLLSSQQSQSLLVTVKLGLPSLRRTVPRQIPMSQCPPGELGRRGPEQRAQPVTGLQQPQGLRAERGLLESRKAQCRDRA